MEIKDFVKSILLQIDSAITDASKESHGDIMMYSSSSNGKQNVEFDIAVKTEESSGKDKGGKIKVLEFAEVGGKKSDSQYNSTVSRVSFSVNMVINT